MPAFNVAVLVILAVVLPLLFVPHLHMLSGLSSMAFMSTLLVTLSIAACAVADPSRHELPEQVLHLPCVLYLSSSTSPRCT